MLVDGPASASEIGALLMSGVRIAGLSATEEEDDVNEVGVNGTNDFDDAAEAGNLLTVEDANGDDEEGEEDGSAFKA